MEGSEDYGRRIFANAFPAIKPWLRSDIWGHVAARSRRRTKQPWSGYEATYAAYEAAYAVYLQVVAYHNANPYIVAGQPSPNP